MGFESHGNYFHFQYRIEWISSETCLYYDNYVTLKTIITRCILLVISFSGKSIVVRTVKSRSGHQLSQNNYLMHSGFRSTQIEPTQSFQVVTNEGNAINKNIQERKTEINMNVLSHLCLFCFWWLLLLM